MKRFWLRYQLWTASLGCPNFWKEFPKQNQAGPWVVEAYTIYFKHNVKNRILVHGDLFNAYVLARQAAYSLDIEAHPTVGVGYDIRRPIEGESYYSETNPTLDFSLSVINPETKRTI